MRRQQGAARRLKVGEHTYLWSVRHHHHRDDTAVPRLTDCSETVSIGLHGAGGRARIVFLEGPGRVVSDSTYLHAGAVVRSGDDSYFNLNLPSVARALLDEVLARGWDPVTHVRFDGWDLLDGALTRLA